MKPNSNKDPQNLESKTQLFFGGADTDTSKEILGATENVVKYIDALNVRVHDASSGKDNSASSIGGEELVNYSPIDGYVSILSANVGSKQVEFWAPINPLDGGIIRIDGDVMCRSDKFNITPENKLQCDVNNDAIGGEIYITDFRLKPMYFSIKDIIDNYGVTQKYFSDFNPDNYYITLIFPPDNIVYDKSPLVSVGTGGGLPTGQYSYSHRLVSNAGDRTNWSVPTPLIFVPYTYQTPNPQQPFAGLKTLGNDPDQSAPGQFGVKMLFRVNNIYNYDYVEIRRTAYNGGEAIDFSPPSYIVKRIPLPLNQTVVQIYEYVDSVSNQSDELMLATSDTQSFLSQISRAKAIRYFFNKVILGNIVYESRDIENKVTFLKSANGNTMTPILESIGSEGYKNPYTHAYKRMYMHAERYGFLLVGWDSNFSKSLAIEIDGFAAYTMPSKRDAMSQILGGDPLIYTKATSRQASTRGIVEETFEIVDYKLGSTRDVQSQTQTSGRNILTGHAGIGNVQSKKGNVFSGQVGYKPFYPKAPYDMQSTYRYTPVESVSTDGMGAGTPPYGPSQPQNNQAAYNPNVFNPVYNALGMCLIGIDSWPDWMTAFSVVRTKKAGRVVAQGMAFYDMVDSNLWNASGGGGIKASGSKNINTIAVQFPDIENGVIGSSIIDDLIANPSSFKIQMSEPLGFNSEVFHFRSCSLNNPSRPGGVAYPSLGHADTQVDMVVYAGCQSELSASSSFGSKRVVGSDADNPASQTGIQDSSEPAGSSGYVSFGIWRNQGTGAPVIDGQSYLSNGNYKFTILNVTKVTQEENITHLVFELGDQNGNPVNIYNTTGSRYDLGDFYGNTTKNWQEPVYICSLLRDGATVQNLDIQSLLSTGTYVKIRSLIGFGTGAQGLTLDLCGERIEDVGKDSPSSGDKYVWVEMNNNGEMFRWINISYLSPIDIATINSDIINGTTNYNGERLYGTYTCSPLTQFSVVFGSFTFIPQPNAKIEVRYDNTSPVYVFGGDTTVGYANFPVVHRSAETSGGTGDQPGDNNTYGSMLKLQRGMPYLWYKLRRNYYILRNSKPQYLPVIQACDTLQPLTAGTDWCKISAVRQMVVLYNCQSYSHLPLAYLNFYPVVNYVMRPTKWDENKTPSEQSIDKQYEIDYPDEQYRWKLGGIRISQFTPDTFNLDYSKEDITDKYSKISSIIYSEETWFPNRVTWSFTRPIQKILAPNLKSFSPLNIFDISDNRGQIQRLYSFKHDGENLFALCEDDICELLTRKRTLSDLSGNSLGVTGNGQDTAFIQEQIWLNEIKKGALKGEFWKTFAENGDEAFYANYNGAFKFSKSAYGGSVEEISNGYFYQLFKSLCSRVQRPDILFLQQDMRAVYNTRDEEYWVRFKTKPIEIEFAFQSENITLFDNILGTRTPNFLISNTSFANASAEIIPISQDIEITVLFKIVDTSGNGIQFTYNSSPLFVGENDSWYLVSYNPAAQQKMTAKKVDKELNEFRDTFLFSYSNKGEQSCWQGVFDYDFDTFNSYDNKLFGQRNDGGWLKNYELGSGVVINGEPLTVRIFATTNPQLQQSYIFQRLRLNSSDKATIKTYNVDDMTSAVSVLDDTDLKNYHGFENLIPRGTDAEKNRASNTHYIFQIVKKLVDKQFFANSITIFYNKIK